MLGPPTVEEIVMSNEKSSKLPIIAALLLGFVGGVVFTFWGKVEPYRERDNKLKNELTEMQQEASKQGDYSELSAEQREKSRSLWKLTSATISEQAEMTKKELTEPDWFDNSSSGK